MPTYLKIPDEIYADASQEIALVRRKTDSNVIPQDIEKVVRSYVYLGQHQTIPDFRYTLSEAVKDSMVKAIQAQTKSTYSFTPNYGNTWVNLEIVESLSLQGLIPGTIARPRAAQISFESDLTEAHKNDPKFKDHLYKGITDFFGVTKDAVDSVLKGLGIPVGMTTVILIIIALVVITTMTKLRIA